MSGDIRTGRKARKIMTVMVAVFAVAIMMAVPFLSAANSEASFTKGGGGYCITAKDAPDDKLAEYGLYSKATTIKTNEGTNLFLKIFNTYAWDTPVVDCESFTVKDYAGMKVEDSKTESIVVKEEVTIEKVRMEYTGIGGALLSDAYDSYEKAVAAIRAEFGTDEVSEGD